MASKELELSIHVIAFESHGEQAPEAKYYPLLQPTALADAVLKQLSALVSEQALHLTPSASEVKTNPELHDKGVKLIVEIPLVTLIQVPPFYHNWYPDIHPPAKVTEPTLTVSGALHVSYPRVHKVGILLTK